MPKLDFMQTAEPSDVLSPEESAEKIAEILRSAIAYDDNKRRPKMRGAEMASACIRLNTFRLHDDSQTGLKGYSCLAAQSGKAVEDLIRGNLLTKNSDLVLLWDEFIPNTKELGLNFSGKLDFLLNIPFMGMTVVDIKTVQRLNDEKRVDIEDVKVALSSISDEDDIISHLETLKNGVRKSPVAMDKYEEQLIAYATMLDISWGMVFIISRSKENFYEDISTDYQIFKITDEMKYLTIAKMLMAQRLADQYALSTRPDHYKKTVHCKYCDFQVQCWNESHNFNTLSDEESNKFFEECYAEAVELYNDVRQKLQWIRDKKIEEASIIKEAYINPNRKTLEKAFAHSQINVFSILNSMIANYKMDKMEQLDDICLNIFFNKGDEE